MNNEILDSIGERLGEAVDRQMIPGYVSMVCHQGNLVHVSSKNYGNGDDEAAIRTIFRFFSMSKPIAAAATVKAHDLGLIEYDDPIAKYLPEFGEMRVKQDEGDVPAKGPITIRHLLTHTSGIGYGTVPSAVQEDYLAENLFAIINRLTETTEEHVKRLAKMPLIAEPGEAWNYGESLGVLGRMIEVVSGKSYGEFLSEHFFEPLGMVDSGFHVPAGKEDRLAELYQEEPDGKIVPADPALFGGSYLEKPSLEYGGAGVVGTPADYLEFAKMLLNKGMHNGTQILSASGVEELMTNQLNPAMGEYPLTTIASPILEQKGLGFGFGGFVIVEEPSDGWVGSVGEYSWSGWANTHFWVDPKEQMVGLVMTQLVPQPDEQFDIRTTFRNIVYGALRG